MLGTHNGCTELTAHTPPTRSLVKIFRNIPDLSTEAVDEQLIDASRR